MRLAGLRGRTVRAPAELFLTTQGAHRSHLPRTLAHHLVVPLSGNTTCEAAHRADFLPKSLNVAPKRFH